MNFSAMLQTQYISASASIVRLRNQRMMYASSYNVQYTSVEDAAHRLYSSILDPDSTLGRHVQCMTLRK